MSSTKAKSNVPSLVRRISNIVFVVVSLSVQIDHSQAEFSPLSSHCFLVDVDIHYNGSMVRGIDFDKATTAFENSQFTKSTTNSWFGLLEQSCGRVKVSFDNLDYKKKSESDLVLAAKFMYQFKDGAEPKPSDKKLELCVNATRKTHDRYMEGFNWMSSIPALKGKDGQEVAARKAVYDKNISHCCSEKANMACCPEGAMFVTGGESSLCECKPGYHNDKNTESVCRPCPVNTYQPRPDMESCQPCPEGKMALNRGSTSCIPLLECEKEVVRIVEGTFTWKKTRLNETVKHSCTFGPDSVTLTRHCNRTSDTKASWTEVDYSRCNPSQHTETLLKLSMTPIDEKNINNITQDLAQETASASELDSYDVTLATNTIARIVDFNSSTTEVDEKLIEVLDNILSVDDYILAESQLRNKTASRLINATERFAENAPFKNGVFSGVARNIEIQVQAITQESLMDDITFVTNSAQQNSSSSNQPEITIAVKALQKAKQQRSDRVVTIIYQNSKLFPVFTDTQREQNDNRTGDVGNIVLAGKFKDAAISDVDGAIKLKFPEDENNEKFLPRCVYWDFNANGGFGNWSTEGCYYFGTKSGYMTCHCNHMTNFAILLTADPDRDERDASHRHVLSVISYVGCGISLIAVILTLVTYVFFRDLRRSNAQTILCHLCVALIGLLVSYFVVATRDPKTTGCLVTGLLVHYFLLATFSWMAVEGINMYLAFVKVMSAHVPRFIPKAVIIGWGIPGLVVTITAATAYNDYSTETSCFLHGLPFYISVFTPAAVVLFMNFIMFVLTMYSLSQMGKEVSQENKMKGYHRVKVALAIMVLLGLTWFFGALAIGSARLLFQYLFCIFNSLQGFAIFWFHCIRQPEVRQCWVDFVRGRRGRQRGYTATTTAPAMATNAVKKTSSTALPKLKIYHVRAKYSLKQNSRSLDRNSSV